MLLLLGGGLRTSLNNVARSAGDVGHNSALAAAQTVQEAALAHIRAAHQRHLRRVARQLTCPLPWVMKGNVPSPGCLLEIFRS